jgi:alpha-L-arabinofuranosidase
MEPLIAKHSAIMDLYDPQRKLPLVVDEWGVWLAPLPGSNPGFLIQQNSLRDAIVAALNLDIFGATPTACAWPTLRRWSTSCRA